MNKVTVKKADLREIVQKNRDDHHAIWVEAKAKHREAFIAELKKSLSEAEAGGELRRTINLVEPSSHTKDYDRVLRMIDLSIEDTVTLDAQEFMHYVQDEWAWSQQWSHSSALYSNHPKLRA